MSVTVQEDALATPKSPVSTALPVLIALSFCHLMNDLIQSLIPSVYPIIKETFHLSFSQIGLVTLATQLTASILQPVVGTVTDRKPMPYSLVAGMGMTLIGLILLAVAPTFNLVLVAAALVGVGSAVFHPESSRMARMASGGQHGFAQSLFQVGGNAGSALGPLLAAIVVAPRGQSALGWFAPVAIVGMIVLARAAAWAKERHRSDAKSPQIAQVAKRTLSRPRVLWLMFVLMMLVFSKYIYLVSMTNYYSFYLIHKFHVSVPAAQTYLFVLLAAVALGTFTGGPLGDRFGRKGVILGSILGVLPFTLALPYLSLTWTVAMSCIIGVIIASAFSAIIVYAQELLPGRVGMVSGLFFGLAFGIAGISAAILGKVIDERGIDFVYRLCSYLPAIGVLAFALPAKPNRPSVAIAAES